jgi:hypothetical protein
VSDAQRLELGVDGSHLFEVVVLADDRQPVLDCGGGYQSIGQLDRAMNIGCPAVGDEAGPRRHHRLADRNGVGRAGERKRVRATGSGHVIRRVEDTKLQLADRDDRDGDASGQLTKGSPSLAGDED